MQHFREKAPIIKQEKLADDIYRIWFKSSDIARNTNPGQFMAVYCNDGSRLLPRPFGVSEINESDDAVAFVYKVVGGGTREFSNYKSGDLIDVMGPLGNGFRIKDKAALLVGGGTGIPILVELAKKIEEESGRKPSIVVGFRDQIFLTEELSKYGNLIIATEDGSSGIKGNVLDAIKKSNVKAKIIYACGPHPMLNSLKEYAGTNKLELQISLEEKMACGIGACLACTCKSKEIDPYTKVHNKRICKEGPVFDADEVEL